MLAVVNGLPLYPLGFFSKNFNKLVAPPSSSFSQQSSRINTFLLTSNTPLFETLGLLIGGV